MICTHGNHYAPEILSHNSIYQSRAVWLYSCSSIAGVLRTKCVTYRYLLGILQSWKCTVWKTIFNSNFPISLPCRNRNLSHDAMQSLMSPKSCAKKSNISFLQAPNLNERGKGTLKRHFWHTSTDWTQCFSSVLERPSLGNNENNKNHINHKSINNTHKQACGCSPLSPGPNAVWPAELHCFLMQELIAASVYLQNKQNKI